LALVPNIKKHCGHTTLAKSTGKKQNNSPKQLAAHQLLIQNQIGRDKVRRAPPGKFREPEAAGVSLQPVLLYQVILQPSPADSARHFPGHAPIFIIQRG
jgi:hypothetical protein